MKNCGHLGYISRQRAATPCRSNETSEVVCVIEGICALLTTEVPAVRQEKVGDESDESHERVQLQLEKGKKDQPLSTQVKTRKMDILTSPDE